MTDETTLNSQELKYLNRNLGMYSMFFWGVSLTMS